MCSTKDIHSALCEAGRRVSAEKRMGRVILAAALCLAGCCGIISAQVTINVPKDQPTIQAGINAANNGDTVLVGPGTYSEAINFQGKAITVESSAGPASTIIDGANNAFVVTFQTNETRSSILSGFTIQDGGTSQAYTLSGGVQAINGSNPSILGNTITNNACFGVYSQNSAPLIQNNEISSNSFSGSLNGNPCSPGIGGSFYQRASGVYLIWEQGGSAPSMPAVVSGNTIENNTVSAGVEIGAAGVSVLALYGAAYPQGLYYVVEDNIVRNNGSDSTYEVGGGLYLYQATGMSGVFSQNLVYGNTAGCIGGGVMIWNARLDNFYTAPTVLFVNNMIGLNSAPTTPVQCFIVFPGSPPPAPDIYVVAAPGSSDVEVSEPTQVEFANNIFFGNTSLPTFQVLGITTFPNQNVILDHNDIYSTGGPGFDSSGILPDPTGNYGNISAAPLFVDAASNDYHEAAGSPTINAGNNSALQQLDNLGWPLTTDFDGNPRIQDATGTGYPIVDMGVYEYAGVQDTGPTTMLLTPSNYYPNAGASVPVTAQLFSPNGTPTGTVTFYANGVEFASAVMGGNGAAIATTAPLSPGVNALVASYPGQGAFTACVSVEILILVQAASTTLNLSSSASPSLLTQSVTFTATLGASFGTPTGSVQFTDNGVLLGSGTINSTGVATYATSDLTAGSHDIEATYLGNTSYGGAQASISQTVLNTLPTTETVTSSLNPSLRNQSVTFTAIVTSAYSATPSGTIAFSDGSTVLATVPLVNGVASFTTSTLPKGSQTITAAYSGDADYASNLASLTQIVSGIPTTTTVVSITPIEIYAAQPSTITATVTGQGGNPAGPPAGTVAFMLNGASIGTSALNATGTATLIYAFPAAGSQAVTATYNADPDYAASSSVTVSKNVLINDSQTALNVTPSPVLVFHTVTLTATVTSVSASAFGVAPNGTVTFMNGATSLGSATLNASGMATLAYSFSQEGNQNLVAIYAGNSAFQPSQSAAQLIVVQPSPTTTTVTASANPQVLGAPVTFTATVSAGPGATAAPVGTVTFYDGATSLGTFTLDATGKANFSTSTLVLGQHPVTASFTNTTIFFLPGVSAVYTESIIVFSTTTTVTANINPQEVGAPVTFTATVAVSQAPMPGLPVGTVTFYNGAVSLGTVTLSANGTATLATSALAFGQYSITASYTSSSIDYLPSVSVVFLETIAAYVGDFSISVSPTSQSLYTGEGTRVITVTITPAGGWDRDITLSCGQLPNNTTCAFNPASVPGANGVSQLVIQTSAPKQIAAAAATDNSPWPKRFRWGLSALGLFFFPFRRRYSRLQRILPAFILAVLLGAMSGCGAPADTGGTPPGVYNVSVTSTFSGYGATLTHSAPFTLTVKSLF